MAIAEPRKKKKTVRSWLRGQKMPKVVQDVGSWVRRKTMPPSSEAPGQIDYPAIERARKELLRRKKMLRK